jgi:hypothetical protein
MGEIGLAWRGQPSKVITGNSSDIRRICAIDYCSVVIWLNHRLSRPD